MKKRRFPKFIIGIILVTVLAVGLPLVGGCRPAPPEVAPPEVAPPEVAPPEVAPPEEEVYVTAWEIPELNIFTGPAVAWGEEAHFALMYGVNEVNALGGIRGKPIYLTGYDCRYEPDRAVSMFAKAEPGALIMYGPNTGDELRAVVPTSQRLKIPFWTWGLDWGTSTIAKPWLLGFAANVLDDLGPVAAEYCKLYPEYKSMLVMTPPESFMFDYNAQMIEQYVERETDVEVTKMDVPMDTVDYSAVAMEAVARNPDIYVVNTMSTLNVPLTRELENLGVERHRILNTGYSFMSPFFDLAGPEILDGTYLGGLYTPFYDGERWQDFLETYREETGRRWPQNGTRFWADFFFMVKDCFEEREITGDPAKLQEERAAISDWFYSLWGYEGMNFVYYWFPLGGGCPNMGATLFTFDGKEPVEVVVDIRSTIPEEYQWVVPEGEPAWGTDEWVDMPRAGIPDYEK